LVLLDANAILLPFQFRLNLEAEIRRLLGDADLAVPRPVLEELDVLAVRDRKGRSARRLADSFRVVEASGSADDAIFRLALDRRAVVATNDGALLARLKAAGIPRIFLRSRSHLVAEGI